MTGKEKLAFPALTGKACAFIASELLLAFAIEHLRERLLTDISQAVFRKHEVVAAVDITVGLHRGSPSTSGRHRADARRLARPIGKRGIEELHEDPADIFLHPLIVDPAEEAAPLLGCDGGITEGRFFCYISKGCNKRTVPL